MTNRNSQKLHQGQHKEHFKNMSNDQLVDAFNCEVGNKGWTSTRASYLAALSKEIKDRFDCEDISDDYSSTSYAKRIKLIGRKVVIKNNE